MGEQVRVWVMALASALVGCVGGPPHHEPIARAHPAPPALTAPPAPVYRAITRISSDGAPAPTPTPSDEADAPPVVIYDHGSGRASASFPTAPAPAAPSPSAPAPAPTPTLAPPAREQPSEPGAAELSSGNVSNAARVVAVMREGFRACYQAALVKQRGLAGSIRLRIRVAADGSVSDVEGDRSGLPQGLVGCVFSRAHRAKFEPPAGGHAVIVVPLRFVEQ